MGCLIQIILISLDYKQNSSYDRNFDMYESLTTVLIGFPVLTIMMSISMITLITLGISVVYFVYCNFCYIIICSSQCLQGV